MTHTQKALFVGLSGLVTFLSITLITEHYLRTAAESTLMNVRNRYEVALSRQERIFNRSFMWYGTIVSVRPAESSMIIDFKNKFNTDMPRLRFSVIITPESVVYRQIPLRRNEVYVGFTQEELISVNGIYPGERVAAVLRINESGEVEAETLIVGGAL